MSPSDVSQRHLDYPSDFGTFRNDWPPTRGRTSSGQNLAEGGVIEDDAIEGGADERNPSRNPDKTDSFRLFQRVERQRSTQRSCR